MARAGAQRRRIRFGRHSVPLPGSRRARTLLGAGLCAGGLVGFLPVLGFWMLPLGALVLSADHPPVRRLRRHIAVAWGRKKAESKDNPARKKKGPGGKPGPKALGNGGVSSREDGGRMRQ